MLGFELTQRIGDQAAFLSAGGYHHHIGLNTWESRGAARRRRRARRASITSRSSTPTGRRSPTRCAGSSTAGIPLKGASDHGVSEAIYLRDPDGNGIELYRDRPRERMAARRRRRLGDVHAARSTSTRLLAEAG